MIISSLKERQEFKNNLLEYYKTLSNEEIWACHTKLDRYLVSNKGNIKVLKTGLVLKQYYNSNNYKAVTIFDRNKKRTYSMVHRLVLETFIPIQNQKFYEVNHIDGNKQNNELDNLEWMTRQENLTHYRERKNAKSNL